MSDRPYPGQYPNAGNQPNQPFGGQPAQPYGGHPYGPQTGQPGQPYGGASFPGVPQLPQAWPPAISYGQQPGQTGQSAPPAASAAPNPPAKNKTGLLIGGIGIGLLVIVLIIVAVARLSGGGGGEGGGGGPVKLSPAEQAKQTVLDYYTAISEGRAADALGLLYESTGADMGLLTDEVLADSLTRAPLTDIVVGEPVSDSPGGTTFDVPVTYNLAGSPVSDELYISDVTDEMRIFTDPPYLSIDKSTGYTINGVAIPADDPKVFPGSYEVATGSEYLVLEGGPLLITKNSDYLGVYDLELVVSEAGIAIFREKVIAEAQACLASMALDPGCGAALSGTLSDGTPIRDGSVMRTQDAESRAMLQAITPTPGSSAPNVISVDGSDLGGIDITAECQNSSGGWSPCELWASARASVSVRRRSIWPTRR